MPNAIRAAFPRFLGLLALGACTVAAGAQAPSTSGARFDNFRYEGRSQENVRVGAGEYRNPILPGYYPDPSITRVGDTYYLVNSSFAHYPGLPLFASTDLVNWRQIGNAIDRPDQFDFSGLRSSRGMFAPDISWHGGTFYLAGTCVDCGGNFVMTARDAKGPWSDPVWLPFEGIDPSIHWEGERAFIVNNRAPAGTPLYEGHRAIWVQEYDWRAGKMLGEATQIVNGGVDLAGKPVWIEGPHLLRRDGYYYLIAAEGGTGDRHSEVVFRSKELRGPFVPWSGNPILSQRALDPARANPVTSAGHAKFVETQDGKWWATFLATRPYEGDYYNIGRETFLLPVEWQDGWPRILAADKSIPLAALRPDLPATVPSAIAAAGDYAYRDAFDGDRLGPEWIGLRTPRKPFYRLDQGALVLDGTVPLGDLSAAPAFVGRRQQHHDATVSVEVRFTPAADGDRAGLAAVQSDRAYLFFGLLRQEGATRIALLLRDGEAPERLVASAPLAVGPVTLSLHARGGRMDLSYAVNGQRTTLARDLDARFLSTKAAGGFVGTVIGPYAWRSGAPR